MGAAGDRPTLLVVDDEASSLEFFDRLLGRDYEVLTTRSPDEALRILLARPVDLVVADYHMPTMSGVELLERAAQCAPQAVRIILSGFADAEALTQAINRAGVRYFIAKPFSGPQVREMIRCALPPRHVDALRMVVAVAQEETRAALCALLAADGYEPVEAPDLASAKTALEEADPAAMFLDMEQGTETLTVLLGAARRCRPPVPVLIVAEGGAVDGALALVRLGAFDVVLRPLRADEVALRASRASERRRMFSEVVDLRRQVERRYSFHELVGGSEKMRAVYELVERIADTDATVMIRGATGTGKEIIARVLHQVSRRRQGPFVVVHCAAIPETLIESELFGHEKGAFTGAVARRIGRFEHASGGTLFLDEIGDMPLGAQVKILRVLQERKIERVGGHEQIPVDARLVAATHVNLEAAVAQGRFRADLFYRLNVVPLQLPALRERPGDVCLLAGHFLQVYCERMKKHDITISSSALRMMENHEWPGNVRELANLVERMVAVTPTGGVISASQLPFAGGIPESPSAPSPLAPPPGAGMKGTIEQIERKMIVEALRAHGGNQSRAAQQLGITRQGLARKLTKYDISD